ncbi:MAG TPA: type I methionyl aminopeptidase [Patescibacteria group bacterium]|nr:type I methionyl aminopeptidase [Patescibacteria group bacterium]
MTTIKKPQEIKIIAEGGHRLAKILEMVIKRVQPGINAEQLDQYAEELIIEAGGRPAFKGHAGFPGTLCVSPNEAVVHGVPRKEMILREGDIVGIDIGMRYPAAGGLYTDMARTVGVGKISDEAKKLIKVTEESFFRGIKTIKENSRLGDLGAAVQEYAEKNGFSVIRSLCGHGVGYAVHEDPKVMNFGQKGTGEILKEGMVLAVEPMIAAGEYDLETLDDGWTAVTKDRKLAAHYENTIVVTKGGCKILTK